MDPIIINSVQQQQQPQPMQQPQFETVRIHSLTLLWFSLLVPAYNSNSHHILVAWAYNWRSAHALRLFLSEAQVEHITFFYNLVHIVIAALRDRPLIAAKLVHRAHRARNILEQNLKQKTKKSLKLKLKLISGRDLLHWSQQSNDNVVRPEDTWVIQFIIIYSDK